MNKIRSFACICLMPLLEACGNVSAADSSDNGATTADVQAAVGDCESRNVILMICDGCGYNQIAVADLYENGSLHSEPYDLFPVVVPMSTWSLSGNVYDPQKAKNDPRWVLDKPTDSGASATAFATGKKTTNGKIGMDENGNALVNLAEKAIQAGKTAGVVSTMPFSHATPASFIAHNADRNDYEAIAKNMIYDSKASVLIGAGNPFYDNDGKKTDSPQYGYVGGKDTWDALAAGTARNRDGAWTLIERKGEFDSLAAGLGKAPERLIGVAEVYSTLQEARSGGNAATDTVGQIPLISTVPELSTMSSAALRVLAQDTAGFFLMIEGGAIDVAGHGNFIARAIEEKTGFNQAVRTVIAWIEKNGGWKENLLVITGDHETGYLTGPKGLYEISPNSFAVDYNPVNRGKGKIPGYAWNSNSHTNQLVPLFAKGACAVPLRATALKLDPVRGEYTDNAIVGKVLLQILGN